MLRSAALSARRRPLRRQRRESFDWRGHGGVIGFAEATGAVPAAPEQVGQAGELHAADEAAQRKALRAVGGYVGASRHTASGPQGHPDCKLRRREKRESSDPLNGRQKTPGPSLIGTGFAATCEEESARLPDTNHRDANGATRSAALSARRRPLRKAGGEVLPGWRGPSPPYHKLSRAFESEPMCLRG
jgi:hypothetical protein